MAKQAAAKETAVPGPVPGTRLTESYVREIGRLAYLFAWPMVNVYNRFLTYDKLPEPGLAGGVLPVAPPNQLSMLHDYIGHDVCDFKVIQVRHREVRVATNSYLRQMLQNRLLCYTRIHCLQS